VDGRSTTRRGAARRGAAQDDGLWTYLLVAGVLAAEGGLESLSDLLARNGFEIGGGKDAIDDGGVARELLGGDWQMQMWLAGGGQKGPSGCGDIRGLLIVTLREVVRRAMKDLG
jgi:hypothetical protein